MFDIPRVTVVLAIRATGMTGMTRMTGIPFVIDSETGGTCAQFRGGGNAAQRGTKAVKTGHRRATQGSPGWNVQPGVPDARPPQSVR
jgi:hypothetical protein